VAISLIKGYEYVDLLQLDLCRIKTMISLWKLFNFAEFVIF